MEHSSDAVWTVQVGLLKSLAYDRMQGETMCVNVHLDSKKDNNGSEHIRRWKEKDIYLDDGT